MYGPAGAFVIKKTYYHWQELAKASQPALDENMKIGTSQASLAWPTTLSLVPTKIGYY